MKKILSFLMMLFVSIGIFAEDYVKITSTNDLTDGTYLIVYETDGLAFDGSLETLDAVSNTISVTINNNVITSTPAVDASTFTYDATNKTLKSASGYYIGKTANSNGLDYNTGKTYTNEITFDSNGNAVITASGGCTLRFNSNSDQKRFRYYKSGQKAIQLYKRTSDITPPEPPIPTITEISTVAEFLALENDKEFKFTGNLVCVQDYTAANVSSEGESRYLYAADETGGIVIYNPDANTPTYETTDVIPGGWTATKTFYKGLPEAGTATDFAEKTGNQNITPIEMTIAEAKSSELLGAWIVIKNVLIREKTVQSNNGERTIYYITSDDTDELELFFGHTKPFDLPEELNMIKDTNTDRYEMYGILGVYNTTRQIMPTGIGQNGEIITKIDEVANSSIKSIKYLDTMGRISEKPFEGVNIVVKEYINGSKSVSKQIYKF